MGYSRFSTRFRRRGFKKVAVGVKPKRKYAPKKKVPRVSFAKRVNAIISRNVENKISANWYQSENVAIYSGGGPHIFNWFVRNTWETNLFNISQGAGQGNRIGNLIKLKRWVIKGMIHPETSQDSALESYLPNSQQGYVDVYFGRHTNNNEITNQLVGLLQNGNSSTTPSGQYYDTLSTINKDKYKIYYHRRFKVGPQWLSRITNPTTAAPNNDFALTATFGFDVCKYICKNMILKYEDTNTEVQNDMIRSLALFATWTPSVGYLVAQVGEPTSLYKISFNSYIEFEDA